MTLPLVSANAGLCQTVVDIISMLPMSYCHSKFLAALSSAV